jgi:hypothetical protein
MYVLIIACKARLYTWKYRKIKNLALAHNQIITTRDVIPSTRKATVCVLNLLHCLPVAMLKQCRCRPFTASYIDDDSTTTLHTVTSASEATDGSGPRFELRLCWTTPPIVFFFWSGLHATPRLKRSETRCEDAQKEMGSVCSLCEFIYTIRQYINAYKRSLPLLAHDEFCEGKLVGCRCLLRYT